MDKSVKLLCVIPWNSPFLWAKSVSGFLNLLFPPTMSIGWYLASGWCSARRKTVGVEMAIQSEADFIWFLDADQVVEQETFLKLWDHVIAGRNPIGTMQPCRGYFPQFEGSKPFQPMCWDEHGKPFTPEKLQTVMYGSLNCFIIATDTFKRLERPWFQERFDETTMARQSSLDQHFTKKLWDAGMPLWVDPSIRPKHMDAMELDWSFQNRFDDLMPCKKQPLSSDSVKLEVLS